ncbi:1-deoxy-D-xylulose-5-phosphate reductoisomerase [Chondrinema litorale]|uniref:1-deoxy-D-xylulose-5-phosphate reductoisomerase n=1 Tax=Chondrinema litorale TaxID=2994555 RepID=UPI002544798D|nr:1-deoxy-D-xylulose-5-phosphate reductoisomerase [Chondrinema litorale]UZR95651.1 1-deoxy-D-xylulose-5-phosphate reductoisomerase [Chondrinema litorale]
MNKKKVAILGSTGSIGTQALEVIKENPHLFEVTVLTAQNNSLLLAQQCQEFKPAMAVIGNSDKLDEVKSYLSLSDTTVLSGEQALEEVVQNPEIDIVLTALVGYAGLKPTIAAIKAGKDIALANKETLVVAGELIMELAKKHQVEIHPVDSEHSAIYQCLLGELQNPIEKIILTASGGPFRGRDTQYLETVTKAQALKHPNWEMGAKITIDSATLMNKGLEVIEAKWLFGLKPEQIDVIVHPQSIIHSMVQFEDGSIKAQMGLPDMKLPIVFALSYPQRIKTSFERFNFAQYPELTFEAPDKKTFRNLQLAFDVLEQGGNMPCALNAANEIAVQRFLKNEISFLGIAQLNEICLSKTTFIANPVLEDYVETDKQIRLIASEINL